MPLRIFWIARRNFVRHLRWLWSLEARRPQAERLFYPKTLHVLPSWSGLLEFRLCWRWSVPPLHGLLLRFRGCVRHPRLVPWEYTAQNVIAFLTVSCQKVQSTGLPFQSVFFRKHLRHPAYTQFPKLKFIIHNFVKKWPWNLRKCKESDVMVNRVFSLIFSSTARTKSSFTTDGRPLRGSSCTLSHPLLNSRTHLRTRHKV